MVVPREGARKTSETTLVLLGGRITTLEKRFPEVEALACANARIVALGANAEVGRLAGPETRVLHLDGRRVLPGFVDSHLHLTWFGLGLGELDLRGTRSLGQLQAALREQVSQRPPGTWIMGRGWDQEVMGGWPTRQVLDRAAPGHPVLLTRVCEHVAAVNSMALELAGIDRHTVDPPGGVIDRGEGGEPTGILREEAMALVKKRIPPPGVEEMARALERGGRVALEAGLTWVQSNDGDAGQGLDFIPASYRRAHESGMPLRVGWDFPAAFLAEVRERGWRTGDGGDRFCLGAAKFFVDGSLGGATAALSEPYADDPGNRGVLTLEPEELREAVFAAARSGIQVAIHAIGDRAVDIALEVLASVPPSGTWWRPRLIHCQVMRPELFRRLLAVGAVACLQPPFVCSDKRFAEKRLGPERSIYAYAWRSFLEHGIPVGFGSDAPVEPPHPMLGIYAAVTRCDPEGNPPGGWFPEQKLTVEEAVRGYTVGSAYAVGREADIGSLAPGKLADLTIWDRDPLTAPASELKDLRPELVVVGGEIAYRRESRRE